MKIKKVILSTILILGGIFFSEAQSLLEKLEKESFSDPLHTLATFKATRISIGHSVETRKKNVLEISLMTRYWNLPTETSNAFVADRMSARVGLEYSFSNRLTYGVGFSSLNTIIDNFLKYRLLWQHDRGSNKFSITLLQTTTYRDKGDIYSSLAGDSFSDKLAFTTQMLIARKFSPNFSLQISPTYVHRNTVSPLDDKNQFALGFGGRYKVSGHVSIVSEFYAVTNPKKSIDAKNAFALGVNWEVSDLMLQFKMTNTGNFVEDAFITQSRRNFNFRDGNLFFGFHATLFLQL